MGRHLRRWRGVAGRNIGRAGAAGTRAVEAPGPGQQGRGPSLRYVSFIPVIRGARLRRLATGSPLCVNENKHLARISTRRRRQQRASKQNCPRTHAQTRLHARTGERRAANLSCNNLPSSRGSACSHIITQSSAVPSARVRRRNVARARGEGGKPGQPPVKDGRRRRVRDDEGQGGGGQQQTGGSSRKSSEES